MPLAMLACKTGLLPRQGHPGHLHAIAFGEEPACTAPSTPYIQDPGIRLKVQLAGNQLQFRFLSLVQGFGSAPVAAGVHHRLIQHLAVEIIPHVVVLPGDLLGSGTVLHVQEPRKPEDHDLVEPGYLIIQAGTQHPGKKFVQCLAIPPAIHIGLTEAKRALRQNAPIELGVVHLDVPRLGAVLLDPGSCQDLQRPFPRNGHVQPPPDGLNWCASTVQPSPSIVNIRQEGPSWTRVRPAAPGFNTQGRVS